MAKRTIRFYAKTADCFCCEILEDGKSVSEEDYDGYPPWFLGDGDGVALEIDLDTGQVQNWKVPSEEEIRRLTGCET